MSTLSRSLDAHLNRLSRSGLLLLLILVVAVFWILEPGGFGVAQNFRVTASQQMPVLLVALSAMITLIIAEFDLSVGATASLANTLVVGLMVRQHWALWQAILAALGAAALVGLVNGLVIVRLQVPAFVATLATGTVVTGVILAYLGQLDLFGAPSSLTDLAQRTVIPGVPNMVIVAALVAAAVFFCTEFLPVGRRMRAVGASRRAAGLSGMAIGRYVVGAFIAGGLLAGLGGIMLGAQLGASSASSIGSMLLPAFAGAFLGATAIQPGRFNVVGTVIAVLFMAFTVDGLQLAGASTWIQPVVNGCALLVAVSVSSWALRARSSRLRREQLRAIEAATLAPNPSPPATTPESPAAAASQ